MEKIIPGFICEAVRLCHGWNDYFISSLPDKYNRFFFNRVLLFRQCMKAGGLIFVFDKPSFLTTNKIPGTCGWHQGFASFKYLLIFCYGADSSDTIA